MYKLFVSGSRSIKTIPAPVILQLNYAISQGAEILVGDCYGVDSQVQHYLAEKNYQNVKIYFSANDNIQKPRYCNPKAESLHWTTIPVISSQPAKTRAFYTDKDVIMSQHCDRCLVVWDEKSAGSKANADRISQTGKPVYIWDNPKNIWLVANMNN